MSIRFLWKEYGNKRELTVLELLLGQSETLRFFYEKILASFEAR